LSGRQRLVLLALAAVIAIAAVLLLRTDEEDDSPPPETTARTQTGPQTKPKPKPPLLTAGSERTLRVERGKTVAFRVRSKTAEEVHVHGYDILRQVPAGGTVSVRFPARLEGVYEIELERSHTPLGKLEVSP
jgi:hypothetical protein